MSEPSCFVTTERVQIDQLPWGPHHWLCKPDLVPCEKLGLVRVHMPPGTGHAFHKHPTMEEIIYVVEGQAEQWVDREKRMLQAGEIAHILPGVVHGTFNPTDRPMVFLAILSPCDLDSPLIDVSTEEPWASLCPRG